jgi:hypothetical protein
MKYLKKFDALDLDTYNAFKHYGLDRDKFMDILKDRKWAKENEIRIEKYNKVVEIKDQIRYDKLSKKDIDVLLKKAEQLRDKSFVIFLRKMSLRFLTGVPLPPKRIKDAVTKQKIEEYLNLDYETYRDL